jgi:hypothetical protein
MVDIEEYMVIPPIMVDIEEGMVMATEVGDGET